MRTYLTLLIRRLFVLFQTELTYHGQNHRPKQSLQMEVRTDQEGLVAFSAMDTALFSLRPSYRDPVTTVTVTQQINT